MKKKNQILVSLSIVALLGGCSEEEVQRDVYNSFEDCLADWQQADLCEQQPDRATDDNNSSSIAGNLNTRGTPANAPADSNNNSTENAHTATSSAESGEAHGSLGAAVAGAAAGYMIARAMGTFMGPGYHPGNRGVTTPSGQVIQPQSNRSVGKPVLVKGNAGSNASKPISRGGFKNTSANNSKRSSYGG